MAKDSDLSAILLGSAGEPGSQRNTLLVDVTESLVAKNGLGIDVISADTTLRAQLGLDDNSGLVITAVPDDSRGAKAGLNVHDVLVRVNDQSVGDAEKLRELLEATEGQAVKLRIVRQGKSLDLTATPKNPPVARLAIKQLRHHYLGVPTGDEQYRIGVTLSGTDETLRSQLRLAEGEGLVVTEVIPDSPAAAVSIQKHDVLTVLSGKRLTTVEAINAQIQEIQEQPVELRLLRGGKELTFQITPRKTKNHSLAESVILWDTQNCKGCHARAHDAAHLLMGARLHASHSAWTDGHSGALYLRGLLNTTNPPSEPAAAQQQIEALKAQLGEMQKTLGALESALLQTKKEE